jgi:hypothetical protein
MGFGFNIGGLIDFERPRSWIIFGPPFYLFKARALVVLQMLLYTVCQREKVSFTLGVAAHPAKK